MEMTVDEIIAKETEIAQEFQKVVDTHIISEDFSLEEMYCDDTEIIEEKIRKYQELADYHNQIADTMHKYQRIQVIINNTKDSDGAVKFNWLYEHIKEVLEDGQNS